MNLWDSSFIVWQLSLYYRVFFPPKMQPFSDFLKCFWKTSGDIYVQITFDTQIKVNNIY